MLATNQQGQTYLVAQQQQPPVNQILLQTSQQQGGTSTKTIIILQQQSPTQCNTGKYTHTHTNCEHFPSLNNFHQIITNRFDVILTANTTQKMIMTTQQGQQMIVTQVPRHQHHVIVNQHSGNGK